jgi:formylglycine-generating enzyme required for sulfatase activity
MTEAAIDCFTPGSSGAGQPICGQLMLMFYDQIPSPALYRVDGLPLDHGPFGNADVFGSVWQWTRTFIEQVPGDQFCNLRDGAPDFVTFPQTSGSPSHFLVNFATSIIQAVRGKNLAYRILTAAPDYTNRYNLGFRCAFDQNPYTLQ